MSRNHNEGNNIKVRSTSTQLHSADQPFFPLVRTTTYNVAIAPQLSFFVHDTNNIQNVVKKQAKTPSEVKSLHVVGNTKKKRYTTHP